MWRSVRQRVAAALDGLPEAGWLLSILALPLFFDPRTATVFEPDKGFLLLHLVVLAAAAALPAAMLEHGVAALPRLRSALRPLLRHPIVLVALAWLALQALSTVLSVAPDVSWLGGYDRRHGLWLGAACVGLFLLVAGCLRTRRQLRRLRVAFALAGSCVAAYAIAQALGVEPIPYAFEFNGRSASTLGNPIFAGAYLAISLLVTLGEVGARRRRGAPWRGPAALAALQGIGLVTTSSRGPALGLLVGAAVALVVAAAAVSEPGRRRRRLRGVLAAGTVLLILVVLVASIPGVDRLPWVGRLTGLLDAASGSARLRLEAWRSVSDLMLLPEGLRRAVVGDELGPLRFAFGYGPETLRGLVDVTGTAELARLGGIGRSLDRSHSEFLDRLASSGSLGLAAYLLLWQACLLGALRGSGFAATRECVSRFAAWQLAGVAAAVGVMVVDGSLYLLGPALVAGVLLGLLAFVLRAPPVPEGSGSPWAVCLLAALVAHLVQLQFGFEIVATRAALWLLAGVVVASELRLGWGPETDPDAGGRDADAHGWLLGVTLTVLALGFFAATPPAGGVLSTLRRSLAGPGPLGASGAWPILLAPLLAAWLLAPPPGRRGRILGPGIGLGAVAAALHVAALVAGAETGAGAVIGSIGAWRLDVTLLAAAMAAWGTARAWARPGQGGPGRLAGTAAALLVLAAWLAGLSVLSFSTAPGRCVAADRAYRLAVEHVRGGRRGVALEAAAEAARRCPELPRYEALRRSLAGGG